jgi:hypothetical protein
VPLALTLQASCFWEINYIVKEFVGLEVIILLYREPRGDMHETNTDLLLERDNQKVCVEVQLGSRKKEKRNARLRGNLREDLHGQRVNQL